MLCYLTLSITFIICKNCTSHRRFNAALSGPKVELVFVFADNDNIQKCLCKLLEKHFTLHFSSSCPTLDLVKLCLKNRNNTK